MQHSYRVSIIWRTLAGLLSITLSALFLSMGSAAAADPAKVRFAWKIKGEYAPFFVALEEGFYAKQGLEVTLGEGAGSQAALASVIQGQDDFFVGPGIFALSGIQKGIPVKLVALYHPSAPIVLLSHPDNPVRKPHDLEGKKIATSVGETGTTYLNTLCALNEVDCSKIERIMMDQRARSGMFMQRRVDVISAYTTNDLPLMRASTGQDFEVLDLAEFGLTIPGMAVVTSNKMLEERGDLARRFLAAVQEGYRATIADPAMAARAIAKHWSNSPSLELIEEQIRESVRITPIIGENPIGHIEKSIIEFSLNLLQEYDGEVIENPAEHFFTNQINATQ